MKRHFSIAVLSLLASGLGLAQEITGDWLGTYVVFPNRVRVVFHFSNAGDKLSAIVDHLEDDKYGIPASSVMRDGPSIKIEIPKLGAAAELKVNEDGTLIRGPWKQGGKAWEIQMRRMRRPQEPVKPYPYREEEVTYENRAAGIRLAGTLTIPQGRGPWPAAILVAGAGPRNRDSQVWEHRPFLVLADYLTRKGIAVLRTDDRGIGKSGGTFETAGVEDFASDAGAALAYVKTRREIDARRIGWIGHREGSVVAAAAAAANPGTAFLVLMPGVGLSGEENIVAQVRYLSLVNHNPAETADQAANTQRKILDIARAEKTAPAMAKRVHEEIPWLDPTASDFEDLAKPWFLSYIGFDPGAALAKVKSPVLALWGEKDREVDIKTNQAAIQKALEAAGNKNVEFAELPGLNHLFQTSDTGLAWQYPEIEETLAPAAMEKVAGWILKTAGK